MAPDQLDGPVGAGRVQAVVVRHDLLPLRVREHLQREVLSTPRCCSHCQVRSEFDRVGVTCLVAPQPVTVGEAEVLPTLAPHRVQAVVRRVVLNLGKLGEKENVGKSAVKYDSRKTLSSWLYGTRNT